MLSEVRYSPASFARMPSKSGSTELRNSCDGSPPHFGFHIHLCPMAQALRGASAGDVMPQRVAATISQCSNAEARRSRLSGLWRSQCRSFAKPPLMRVDAATPVDCFEVLLVRERGNLLRFMLRPVIAPQVVIIERLHLCIDGNHARSCGVEGYGGYVACIDPCLLDDLTRCLGERVHLIAVRLGGLVWIGPAALKRILCNRCSEPPLLTVQQGDTNAQRAKVHSSHDCHSLISSPREP